MSITIFSARDVGVTVTRDVTASISTPREADAERLAKEKKTFVNADLLPCILIEARLPHPTFPHPWVCVYSPQLDGGRHELERKVSG